MSDSLHSATVSEPERPPRKRFRPVAFAIILFFLAAVAVAIPLERRLSVQTQLRAVGGWFGTKPIGPKWLRSRGNAAQLLRPLETIERININSGSLPVVLKNPDLFRDVVKVDLTLENLDEQMLQQLFGPPDPNESGSTTDDATGGIFRNLNRLRIDGTPLTDAHLKYFGKFHQLELLSINDSRLTDAGFATLTNLKSLQRVDLRNNALDGTALQHLSGSGYLASLLLVDTVVNDDSLTVITDSVDVKSLNLSGTRITDRGLVHLVRMPSLKSLSLENTNITDAGLAELARLPRLESLWLSNTKVTDDGLMLLATSPTLSLISVRDTRVSSAGVEAFARATSGRIQVLHRKQSEDPLE